MTETAIAPYDNACRALAEARSVDEVKDIRDQAIAMAAYARQAKNRDLEADAVEIRMRATRRLDQLRQAQKDSVGLNEGGRPKTWLLENPVLPKPTLASQGIDKNLAQQARVLGALSEQQFEARITEARDAVARVIHRVVQVADIDLERAKAAASAEPGGPAGGTVDGLIRLAASGYRASTILADCPWQFVTWSHCGLAGDKTQDNRSQRSRAAPYKTMPIEEICTLPVEALAAKDCVLFFWVVRTRLWDAMEVIRRWGFGKPTSVAFGWFKGEDEENPEDIQVPMGTGYWTRAGFEQCWIATRGNPRRLYADVREVIIEPRREHSRKPDCVHDRIERLVAGPYLELFARRERPKWTTWGNEIPPPPLEPPYDAAADFAGPLEIAYAAIRERAANGGPPWMAPPADATPRRGPPPRKPRPHPRPAIAANATQ
jgi:N6-adenosine-specific RNA methylase IME4